MLDAALNLLTTITTHERAGWVAILILVSSLWTIGEYLERDEKRMQEFIEEARQERRHMMELLFQIQTQDE